MEFMSVAPVATVGPTLISSSARVLFPFAARWIAVFLSSVCRRERQALDHRFV